MKTDAEKQAMKFQRIQPPSIGRIVLYRSENHGWLAQGGEVPAIIVRVNAISKPPTVNLRCFPDLAVAPPYVADVPYNDNLGAVPNDVGYWRWPVMINPGVKA